MHVFFARLLRCICSRTCDSVSSPHWVLAVGVVVEPLRLFLTMHSFSL